MLSKYFKYLRQIIYVFLILLTLHNHIVYVHLYRAPNLILEHLGLHPLISSPRILKAERNYYVVVIGFRVIKDVFS